MTFPNTSQSFHDVLAQWQSTPERISVTSPEAAALRVLPLLTCQGKPLDHERVVLLALDHGLNLIDEPEIISYGTDQHCLVDKRAILRWALTRSRLPRALVLAHNHPSGSSRPSQEDKNLTRAIVRAASILDLEIADHIVVGGGGRWTSIRNDYPDCWF